MDIAGDAYLIELVTHGLTAVVVYLLLVAPPEMVIHEFGHLYFQKKFGILVQYLRFGIPFFKKDRYITLNFYGTPIKIGIPFLLAEARCLGEMDEWENEKNNPQSFSYVDRHPKERIITALAGPLVTLFSALIILSLVSITCFFGNLTVPLWAKMIFGMIFITEVSNLIPAKLGYLTIFSFIALIFIEAGVVLYGRIPSEYLALLPLIVWIIEMSISKLRKRSFATDGYYVFQGLWHCFLWKRNIRWDDSVRNQ